MSFRRRFFYLFKYLCNVMLGVSFTLAHTFSFMDSLKIEDYQSQLMQLCDSCTNVKCKSHECICFKKKLAFNIAKTTYKKRLKEAM